MRILPMMMMLLAGFGACPYSQAAPLPGGEAVNWSELSENPLAGIDPGNDRLAPAPPPGTFRSAAAEPAGDPRKVFLILPAYIEEGGSPGEVTFKISRPVNTPIKFVITASPAGVVSAPAGVVLPAGQRSVSFRITAKNDDFTSLNRLAGIGLTVPGTRFEIRNYTRILDDEKPPAVTLRLPDEFREGDATEREGTITLDRPLEKEGFVDLVQSSRNQLTMEGQALIPAGKKQVKFKVSAFDDEKIDGDVTMVVSANAGPRVLAEERVKVWDNESSQLALVLPPSVYEGDNAVGTVRISGTMGSDLVVSLSDENSSALGLPAKVTIPAGQSSATFKISSRENSLRDGSRSVNISAKAKNLTGVSQVLVVLDDEVGGFRISGFDSIHTPGNPIKITVSAVDVDGNVIPTYFGRVDLNALLSSGASQPLTPGSVTLIAGSATITVKLPVISSVITGVGASDGAGNVGKTVNFDTARTLAVSATQLLWDEERQRIYALVPGAASPLQVIDPVAMTVTHEIAPGPQPVKMALTSGGEYLYVSLKGNGTIAKIDPDTMEVVATFAVGTDLLAGKIYAAEMVTVAGQPEWVVASRQPIGAGWIPNTIAVYDQGIPREVTTAERASYGFLHPSADPTIVFDFYDKQTNGGYMRLRRLLKLDANGISEVAGSETAIFGWTYFDGMRTAGDTVFFSSGNSHDGLNMKSLGRYSASGGTVCPDLATNRIFYIEDRERIAAYDPVTRNLIQQLKIPLLSSEPSNFIRCGDNDLAYCTSAGITVVHSPRLVPADPAADLVTTVEATSLSPNVGAPVTFTIKLTNPGPDIARNAFLSTRFSGMPTIGTVTTTKGLPKVAAAGIEMPVGDLGVGMSATLSVNVTSAAAGSVGCTAQAGSHSIDPDFSNSAAFRLVNFGYQTLTDAVNKLDLIACSQVHDSQRGLIWLALPGFSTIYDPYYDSTKRIMPPLARSIVSLDPLTGVISKPIPLNGDPLFNSMGLSGNGRYLYVGLRETGEISRIDLEASPPQLTRIPLPPNQYGNYPDAGDIEVLEGDGTSILLTTGSGESVMVIDGVIPRPVQIKMNTGTEANKITSINKTGDPGLFTAFHQNNLYQLSLTGDGVTVAKSRVQPYGIFPGTRGDGELWLWNTSLMYVNSLAQRVDLLPWGLIGGSFFDAPNQRAYILDSTQIRSFNTGNNSAIGTFKLVDYDWELGAKSFTRWGSDGFSVLSYDGIFIARWSLAAPAVSSSRQAAAIHPDPATGDADGDGIPNAFEHLFATSPSRFDQSPIQLATTGAGEKTVIHLTFPRRAGVTMPAYGYQTSRDLTTWETAGNVSETILSTRMIDGVEVETIDAAIPAPAPDGGFVRLRWLQP